MTKQEMRHLIERYLSAYNAFDVEAMMATIHPEIEFQNFSGEQVTATAFGAEEFRQLAQQATALFKSRRQVMTTFVAEETGASVDIAYEGVLAADLPNGMKAGQTLRLNGRSEFEFKDGKISRLVDYS
ncbi:nuclear transport factor 2 family protein [Almyronema epifaneia]|uniref:Nuclear transport factor 2 family protein n=1 Tax=Almyronema epifaneia S1 TaxID=2991925 RepID=A0ABW6ICQ8_9CYAN